MEIELPMWRNVIILKARYVPHPDNPGHRAQMIEMIAEQLEKLAVAAADLKDEV
jgi:hypothetical protein